MIGMRANDVQTMPFFESPPFLLTIDWGGAMLDGRG